MGPPEPPLSGAKGTATPWPLTLADKDLLGRLVQGQVGTARPENDSILEALSERKPMQSI